MKCSTDYIKLISWPNMLLLLLLFSQSCPTHCDPRDCSTPGFPVYHQLPELTQTCVHRVSDAIQPSHPLSSPSPPVFNLSPASESFPMSQFFASSGQSIGASISASVLPMNIQDWFPLGLTGLISLLPNGLSKVFSSTTFKSIILQCSAFFTGQLSHLHMTAGKTITLTIQTIWTTRKA